MLKKPLVITICAVLCIAVAGTLAYVDLGNGQMSLLRRAKYKIFGRPAPVVGHSDEEIIDTADGKKVLMDHPKGYSIEFPGDMKFDNSNSPNFIKFYNDDITAIVTREWSPYEDIFYFMDKYLNKYFLQPEYQQKNNVTIHENTDFDLNGAKARIISLSRYPEQQLVPRQNSYTYFYVLSTTGERAFFRVMFKAKDYNASKETINEICNSFKEIPFKGESRFTANYSPVLPKWNKETLDFYNNIKNSNKITWGLFVDGAYKDDVKYGWLENIENKVDYKFDFSLNYVNLTPDFPKEQLKKMYDRGKITELTLQISYHANSELLGKNLSFDVYDGVDDETIRSFARGAKEFGHPFLFRLNNEMNSDWVNYSGVAALSDPEIFIENWRRIFDIFNEEGVDNAIWVFNPNAEECPPCHWNVFNAYFPGEAYVHMIGLTGYNTGTYYAERFHEKWRTFDEIYKDPYDKYMIQYKDYPFIITEFAASSVGGDKAGWISDMFTSIKNYPNIKMALWWSSCDYDIDDPTYGVVARPYFLDETDETTKAFKAGVKEYK